MHTPLHILHLEDDPLDADLIRRKLEADGLPCEIQRGDTELDFSLAQMVKSSSSSITTTCKCKKWMEITLHPLQIGNGTVYSVTVGPAPSFPEFVTVWMTSTVRSDVTRI